jgi:TRAP-type transport system periplasmic protein
VFQARGLGISILVLAVAVTFLFTGPQGWAQQYTIKLSHGQPPVEEENIHQAVNLFKKFAEQRSGGRIKVEIYPANQLGKEREQFEGLQQGTIEMCMIAEGPIAGFFPEVRVLGIPYLFSNEAVAHKALDSAFGSALFEEMRKKTRVRALGIGENGFRNFTNRVRPIKSPDDMKGLKIRTMENPAHMAMVRALGASPTPIAWGEVYMALQQGVVDGQENPVSVIEVAKFYEVQKYLTLDGHVYSILPILISDKFYNSLPADLRSIVRDGGYLMAGISRAWNMRHVFNGVKILQDKGMIAYTPTEKELQMFRDRTQKPVIDFIQTKVDKKWIDMALKAAKDAEKE